MNTLFHGSDKEITKPVLGAGRADCDYGSGFYLSDDYEVAKMWASNYTSGGYVNTYKIDLSNLRILWLNHSNLEEAMELGNLGLQHVLISKKAFDQIVLVKSDRVPHDDNYDSLEESANRQYEKIIRKRTIHQTYLRDIIREIDKS